METMITKTKSWKGYTYRTANQTRNDKRDFAFALLQIHPNGHVYIIKLANNPSGFRSFLERWWYSHAIAVEIETGKILFERER